MIDFTTRTDNELKKFNSNLRTQIQNCKRGWITQMKSVYEETLKQVTQEMRKRNLVFTIKTSEL